MKLLILCEKPDVKRKFEKALGGTTGFFNGNYFQIVASHGHLLTLDEPANQVSASLKPKYADWSNINYLPWNLNDFSWKNVFKTDNDRATFNYIEQASFDKDAIVIATDNDPSGEGDVLGWEIVNALDWKGKVYRIRFADETPKGIIKSLNNWEDATEQFKQPIYLAGLARQRFDYASMQYSRMALYFARQAHHSPATLRLGRLKSVILNKIYLQTKAINEYVKKPFYEVRFKDSNGNIFKRSFDEATDMFRFNSRTGAEKDLINYVQNNVVIIDETKGKSKQPPALLDLGRLSVLLAKKGYTPKQILTTYQRMYEAGIVSYPRTADTKITQGNFDELLPLAPKIADVVGVSKSLLTHKLSRKKFIITKADHGANRPGLNVPNSLTEISAKYGALGQLIYETLAKSYLAMLCEDYEYDQIKAHLNLNPDFKSEINVPKKLGYKAIFDESSLNDDDDEEQNTLFSNSASPFIFEGANPKPKLPTHKFLINYLDKTGIGTAATRLSTISDISEGDRALIQLKKRVYCLTGLGKLQAILSLDCKIADEKTSKKLFDLMNLVKKNQANWKDIPNLINDMVLADKEIMQRNITKLKNVRINMKEVEYITGKFNGQDVAFKREWGGHKFTDTEVQALLAGQSIKIRVKSGEVSGRLARQQYNDTLFWGFKAEEKIYDEKTYITGKFNGQEVHFKREWGGHKFTDSEIQALLAGQVIKFSVKGGEVSGKLDQQQYKGKPFWGFKAEDKTYDEAVYATGMYDGEEVHFKRVWGNHIFTTNEIQTLLAGGSVSFDTAKGNVKGILAKQKYKGKSFWGFKPEIDIDPDNYVTGKFREKIIKFKRVWGGHRFTDEEVAALLAGKVISFRNINDFQVEYTAHGKLAKQSFKNSEGKTIKYYGFKFLTPEAAAEFKLKE